MNQGASARDLPKVSFAIPVHNATRTLERCLKSIVMQDYHDLEIVIVDNLSDDCSPDIARKYTDKVFSCGASTLGEVRQLSIKKSSGEIIAIFDSDIIIPHKRWLKGAVMRFREEPMISTVWPPVIPLPNSSLMSKCYVYHQSLILSERRCRGIGVLGGGNSLFRRSCIEAVGGIDRPIHWWEDFYLAKKIKDANYKVVYHDDPLYHDTHNSVAEFMKKDVVRARIFWDEGTQQFTDLSKLDMFYEQFALGIVGMAKGLLRDHELAWALFPLMSYIRIASYSASCLARVLKK